MPRFNVRYVTIAKQKQARFEFGLILYIHISLCTQIACHIKNSFENISTLDLLIKYITNLVYVGKA